MKYLPRIVTLRITSRCNYDCKHCFVLKNHEEMSFLKLKKLFHLFYKWGVKAIVLTGGEPLLRGDFEAVIKELDKYGFKIFLDTNGNFFFKYKNLISKYIKALGLPIDFSNSSYRSKNNFKIILKILNYYKKFEKRPIIRIGTVVTKENLKDLDKIGELLKNYPIDIWKIYEFTPQKNTNSSKNKSFLEISQNRFDKETKKLKNVFSKFFKVVISKRKDRNCAYFFVDSNGTVFMPFFNFGIGEEKKIGTVFDKDILNKWERLVSKNNYLTNAKLTFGYKF